MAIITADKISIAFGDNQLLDRVNFALEKNDKFGLIGRNGAGKSSLLKILAGVIRPDDGQLHFQSGLKIIYVAQEPELNPENTIFDEIMQSLGELSDVLTRYYALLDSLAHDYSEEIMHQISDLEIQIEHNKGWAIKNLIDKILAELNLDGTLLVGSLSGGMRKKVALAKAFVVNPDVIFLDEPTNHLDIGAIIWLEQFIINFSGAIVLITHDRQFLDHTVNKILELDRGNIRIYPGNFTEYSEIKAKQLADEAKSNAEFDKFLAQEEVWIRKGIEARRTRNEGRVRRLHDLRQMRSARRDTQGQIKFEVDIQQLSGKIVAEIEHLNVSFSDKVIINDFSAKILRGDKIGLIGNNGVGKSTLLKAILGEIKPNSGTVKLGTKLEVAYFDQLREVLDENATLQEVVAQGQDFVFVNNRRKHIATYLEEFLFSPARFRSPVSSLSGGERNRLLLARLFSQPANVLVLDEPTNDLDMETLELLEELLANFAGTVFLVSHDREFLDNVVTQSWVFVGDGKILPIAGGYTDWIGYKDKYYSQFHSKNTNKSNVNTQAQENTSTQANASVDKVNKASDTNKKLSYKQKQELAELPKLINDLEREQQELQQKLLDPKLYRDSPELAKQYNLRINTIEELLVEKLELWAQLEQCNS